MKIDTPLLSHDIEQAIDALPNTMPDRVISAMRHLRDQLMQAEREQERAEHERTVANQLGSHLRCVYSIETAQNVLQDHQFKKACLAYWGIKQGDK